METDVKEEQGIGHTDMIAETRRQAMPGSALPPVQNPLPHKPEDLQFTDAEFAELVPLLNDEKAAERLYNLVVKNLNERCKEQEKKRILVFELSAAIISARMENAATYEFQGKEYNVADGEKHLDELKNECHALALDIAAHEEVLENVTDRYNTADAKLHEFYNKIAATIAEEINKTG